LRKQRARHRRLSSAEEAEMNWFTIAAGLLYVGAAVHEAGKGSYFLACSYVAYAVANFFLARA